VTAHRVAHVVACAAPPVHDLATFVDVLAAADWSACVILTETAAEWVDVDAIAEHTGRPVRIRRRMPGETDPFPPPDALVAAPLTFNTLNQWAAGVSNTLALGNLNRAIGLNIPVVAVPVVSPNLRVHPAYPSSIRTLTTAGVVMLDPDELKVRREGGHSSLDWKRVVGNLPDVAVGETVTS